MRTKQQSTLHLPRASARLRMGGRIIINNKKIMISKTLATSVLTASLLFSAQADITSGLVGYWHLSEGPGHSTVADSSGNGNTGTLTAFSDGTYDDMWTTASDPSNAGPYVITFNTTNVPGDGTAAYVSIPDSASLNITSGGGKKNWSISAWVKCSVAGGSEPANAGIVAQGLLSGTAYAYDLYMTGGKFTAAFRNNGNNGGTSGSSVTIPVANIWYHVVAVVSETPAIYPPSTMNSEVWIYVNGVMEYGTNSNTYTTMETSTSAVTIGCFGAGVNPFQGTIDEVRIYNRVLTPGDVLELYHNALYWDATSPIDASPGAGGAGSWDSSTSDWWGSGSVDNAWHPNMIAFFEGTAGTVTLNASEIADGLNFTVPDYTIAEGSGSPILTLAGPATITVPSGTTTIDCPIAGGNVNVSGSDSGTLVFGGPNTYTGVTTLNGGVPVIGHRGKSTNEWASGCPPCVPSQSHRL